MTTIHDFASASISLYFYDLFGPGWEIIIKEGSFYDPFTLCVGLKYTNHTTGKKYGTWVGLSFSLLDNMDIIKHHIWKMHDVLATAANQDKYELTDGATALSYCPVQIPISSIDSFDYLLED